MSRLAGLCLLVAFAAGSARASGTRCWFEGGAVVIPAAFGDIAGDFILDLSAPRSLLHATRAQSDGIEATAASRDLRVAGKRVDDVTMDVVDLDARTKTFTTSIAGVLGADVASRFVVDIRFAPCRVILYRRAPTRLAGAIRLKTWRVDGVAAIRAAVSDGVRTRAGLFAIDTGASATRVAGATLSRTPAAGHAPPIRLRGLSVAAAIFEQIPAALMEGNPTGLDGAIGSAVWSRHDLRLDMRQGWLDLAPFPALHGEGGSRSDPGGEVGIVLTSSLGVPAPHAGRCAACSSPSRGGRRRFR